MKWRRLSGFGSVGVGVGAALFLVLMLKGAEGQDVPSAWQALRDGKAVALMRHADAPGTGDPPGFSLRDCSTQRNLSGKGRDQSRKIGDHLRNRGIKTALVYSSQWCRCLETARLLGLGPVRELPALNSFFEEPKKMKEQTEKIREFLRQGTFQCPRVLVTHQVNITALTEVFPASGEIIIYQADKSGTGKVLARVAPGDTR